MIAKGTIIGDERVVRGLRSDETAQFIAAMAVALQWHVATNANEPVALATSRSAETGAGDKDVLLVVCDARQEQGDDARTAAELARSILDAYDAREATPGHPFNSVNSVNSHAANGARHPAAERTDVAQRLADAVTSGIRSVKHNSVVPVPSGEAVSATPKPATHSVVAAVIHHNTLYVARYGGGQAYLLRNGSLQHLTDAAFVGAANAVALEPDLGQLDLAGEDRVLLSSEGFARAVNDTQLRNILRSTPSSRRAAQTLLDVATRDTPRDSQGKILSLAVADYVTGRSGVFPNTPASRPTNGNVAGPRRGTFRSIVAVVTLLLLIAGAVWAVSTIRRDGRFQAGVNGNSAAPGSTRIAPATPASTIMAVGPVTPTATVPPTVAPTASPEPEATQASAVTTAVVTVTGTVTPEPTLTLVPSPTVTATIAPTDTPAPTPTRRPRPTRRPPTPTPVPPTATPVPPTPPPAPTNTPVPPPPPSNGGGGGGQPPPPPPPPCPPGATCG